MKRALTAALTMVLASAIQAAPLGTAFIYQGRLLDGGTPANGLWSDSVSRCTFLELAICLTWRASVPKRGGLGTPCSSLCETK